LVDVVPVCYLHDVASVLQLPYRVAPVGHHQLICLPYPLEDRIRVHEDQKHDDDGLYAPRLVKVHVYKYGQPGQQSERGRVKQPPRDHGYEVLSWDVKPFVDVLVVGMNFVFTLRDQVAGLIEDMGVVNPIRQWNGGRREAQGRQRYGRDPRYNRVNG